MADHEPEEEQEMKGENNGVKDKGTSKVDK